MSDTCGDNRLIDYSDEYKDIDETPKLNFDPPLDSGEL